MKDEKPDWELWLEDFLKDSTSARVYAGQALAEMHALRKAEDRLEHVQGSCNRLGDIYDKARDVMEQFPEVIDPEWSPGDAIEEMVARGDEYLARAEKAEARLKAALAALRESGDNGAGGGNLCWCGEYCHQMAPGERHPQCEKNRKLLVETKGT